MALPVLAAAQVREKRVVPLDSTQIQGFESRRRAGVAILVGVGRYPRYSQLAELKYPGRDVDLLEKELTNQRYSVVALKDAEATREAVLNAIRQAGEVLDPASGVMLFFFSGHGFAEGATNFLATYDASGTALARSGLAIPAVERALTEAGATRRVLWIDACRNEPGKGAGDGRSFTRFAGSAGTRILFSTKAGRISYEDEEFHQGLFSYYLLKGLQGEAARSDGLISFRDLADYVTDAVETRSLRQGHVQVPYEAGESSGDFLIGKTKGAVTSTPPPQPGAPQPTAPLSPNAAYLARAAAETGVFKTESGVLYKMLHFGTGDFVKAGDMVTLHYTGTLIDGKKVDSSYDRKSPFKFRAGAHTVIKCWDEGVQKMSVGGKYQLICPPELAYGEKGAGNVIPGGSITIWEIEVLDSKGAAN